MAPCLIIGAEQADRAEIQSPGLTSQSRVSTDWRGSATAPRGFEKRRRGRVAWLLARYDAAGGEVLPQKRFGGQCKMVDNAPAPLASRWSEA